MDGWVLFEMQHSKKGGGGGVRGDEHSFGHV